MSGKSSLGDEKLGRMCVLGGEGEIDEAVPFCYWNPGVSKYSLGKRVCSLERDANWY